MKTSLEVAAIMTNCGEGSEGEGGHSMAITTVTYCPDCGNVRDLKTFYPENNATASSVPVIVPVGGTVQMPDVTAWNWPQIYTFCFCGSKKPAIAADAGDVPARLTP